MSETYAGSTAGPVNVSFTIPTDGDDVNAVSVNEVFQPLADNAAYAKQSYPDLFAGGTWTFTPQVNTSNAWKFNGDVIMYGSANVLANGGTFFVGFSGLGNGVLQINSSSEFAAAFGSICGVSGTWAYAATATLTFACPMLRSGAAVLQLRETVPLNSSGAAVILLSDVNVDPSRSDTLLLGSMTTGTNFTWTLIVPPAGVACSTYIHFASGFSFSGAGSIAIVSNGNTLRTITNSNSTWVDFRIRYCVSDGQWNIEA